jgi:DNA-binding beta-propeller fold protein YncE
VLDRATLESWGVARPARLAFDADGALYILDTTRRRLVKVSPEGRLLHEVTLSGEDSAPRAEPGDIVADARGSILILDRAAASVGAYDKSGSLLASHPLGTDLGAEARDPRASLLMDAFGRLWLVAPRERDLVRLDASLARARAGRFLTPEDSVPVPRAAVSAANGEVWIADGGTLRRFHASGALAGTVPLGDTLAAAIGALASDRWGYVYAADGAGQRILVFGPTGARALERMTGGASVPWRPGAIAWSPFDRLAVADPERGEVQLLGIERGSP